MFAQAVKNNSNVAVCHTPATKNATPNVMTNIINRENNKKMYVIAMSNNLLKGAASSFYRPSLPVDYEMDTKIWNFINDTNKC
ncbi:ORF157 [White spot syndrome virus]|uniref:ORF157 n=1 Tax=White spot syndrome virus TaxID=342409 RepID=Q91L95_9VIRU|nr:ORF157 [White spot syndrome virus]WOG35236.1 wsv324 [White spot syndrome virus]